MMGEEFTGYEFQEKSAKNQDNPDVSSIYIGNVPWKATKEDISLLISSKTNVEVEDVRIVKEKGTGRSRGFAFVDIKHKDPEGFIRTAPELVLSGRTLTVKYANDRKPKEEIEPGNSITDNLV